MVVEAVTGVVGVLAIIGIVVWVRAPSAQLKAEAELERQKAKEVIAIGKQACDEARSSLEQLRVAQQLLANANEALLKHAIEPQLQVSISEFFRRVT